MPARHRSIWHRQWRLRELRDQRASGTIYVKFPPTPLEGEGWGEGLGFNTCLPLTPAPVPQGEWGEPA